MNNSLHIRRTTAFLIVVIAVLVGALVATISYTHNPPVTLGTAHAASVSEQAPFGTFAPLVKRALRRS